MTFSILTHDTETGIFAGAAATGSLCVGGWVLRGDIDAGLCASQGTAPSTFWRDDAMRMLHGGMKAAAVVDTLTQADAGHAHRQLSVLDATGGTAGFTGEHSVPAADVIAAPGLIVAGNMLRSRSVLDALARTFTRGTGPTPDRLIAALRAAEDAGGDSRGLQSAALLVLSPNAPPIDLRIDHSTAPLDDLAALARRVGKPPYADWLGDVPVRTDRSRVPDDKGNPGR